MGHRPGTCAEERCRNQLPPVATARWVANVYLYRFAFYCSKKCAERAQAKVLAAEVVRGDE